MNVLHTIPFKRAAMMALIALSVTHVMPPSHAMAQQPTAAHRSAQQDVLRLLSAYHELPAKQLFEEAGPDVVTHLHQIVASSDVLRAHKYRAIEALATYWPGTDTTALIAALLTTPEHELMRHQLLVIASKHLTKKEATALISPWLTHSDEQLRYTAVDALGRVHTAESRELLIAARRTEKSDWVKAHMDAMLVVLR